LERTAENLATTSKALLSRLGELPSFDFYMPFRKNRERWTAANDVLVAAVFDKWADSLVASDGLGRGHVLYLKDRAPNQALMAIHPSEQWIERKAPKKGRKILMAGASEYDIPLETLILMDCDELMEQSCEDSQGGSMLPQGLYVSHFYSYEGDGWFGSLEMQIHPRAWDGHVEWLNDDNWYFDVSCAKGTIVYRTLEEDTDYYDMWLLSENLTSFNTGCDNLAATRGFYIRLWEVDGGMNLGGDDWGIRFYAPGSMPFGATAGFDMLFREHDGATGQLKAEMKVEFR
jgi:hypothetical protein